MGKGLSWHDDLLQLHRRAEFKAGNFVELQDVMRLLVHLNYSREESTKYTEEWVQSPPWRMEARTDISRLMQRNLFQKVLKDVFTTIIHSR